MFVLNFHAQRLVLNLPLMLTQTLDADRVQVKLINLGCNQVTEVISHENCRMLAPRELLATLVGELAQLWWLFRIYSVIIDLSSLIVCIWSCDLIPAVRGVGNIFGFWFDF